MHTEQHIAALGDVEPEALDGHLAKLHRVFAGEQQRPPAELLGETSGYPPNCAHGMNSLTDGRYHRALARLRRG
ncbi:MAG: hypothetical protein WBP81_27705 [Solirubrobacteraceae bacterium]